MGRRALAAIQVMARYSQSTPMVRDLRTCIVSQQLLILTSPTTTELIRTAGWLFRATPCMGPTTKGGNSGNGTVFSIFIQPRLTLIPSGPYVILTWPTNYTGFTLQSTTNLVSPTFWSTVSPGPVVIGGQNVVINTVSSAQQFYRLSQ